MTYFFKFSVFKNILISEIITYKCFDYLCYFLIKLLNGRQECMYLHLFLI